MTKPNQFQETIKHLKSLALSKGAVNPKAELNGLSFRLEKLHSGLWELTAWRPNVAPSLHEIGVLVAAIRRVDDPQLITRSEIEPSHDGKYYAYRLWWWDKPIAVSWHQPIQREIPINGNQNGKEESKQRHNYQDG